VPAAQGLGITTADDALAHRFGDADATDLQDLQDIFDGPPSLALGADFL
jgi:hypothetical protein